MPTPLDHVLASQSLDIYATEAHDAWPRLAHLARLVERRFLALEQSPPTPSSAEDTIAELRKSLTAAWRVADERKADYQQANADYNAAYADRARLTASLAEATATIETQRESLAAMMEERTAIVDALGEWGVPFGEDEPLRVRVASVVDIARAGIARPVLTAERLAEAISAAHDDAVARWSGVEGAARESVTMMLIAGADVLRHLGPATLPAAPAAVSDEEVAEVCYDAMAGRSGAWANPQIVHEPTKPTMLAGIRAVRALLAAHPEPGPDPLATALSRIGSLLDGRDPQAERSPEAVVRMVEEGVAQEPLPIAMRLPCPSCGALHIDEGEFATKRHHTHSCQGCGLTWRPAVVATVGVQFLPGFKNEPAGAAPLAQPAEHAGGAVSALIEEMDRLVKTQANLAGPNRPGYGYAWAAVEAYKKTRPALVSKPQRGVPDAWWLPTNGEGHHFSRYTDDLPRRFPGDAHRIVPLYRGLRFDFAAFFDAKAAWSRDTFGPRQSVHGVVAHLRKELAEVLAKPDDVGEPVDLVMLAIDLAWRFCGADGATFTAALVAKFDALKKRTWPDWRTLSPDAAIEHARTAPTEPADEPRERGVHLAGDGSATSGRTFTVSGVTVNTETGTVTQHAPVNVTLPESAPVAYHDDSARDPDVALETAYWRMDTLRAKGSAERDAFKAAVRSLIGVVPVDALVEALEWITSESCRRLTLPQGDKAMQVKYQRLSKIACDAIPDEDAPLAQPAEHAGGAAGKAMTVEEARLLPDVASGLQIIEYRDGHDDVCQWNEKELTWRFWNDDAWTSWDDSDGDPGCDDAAARLVPRAEADASPLTRGPLSEAK